jgi:hypothetical protein
MIKQSAIHGQCFELYSPDDGRTLVKQSTIDAYRRRKKMLRLELQKRSELIRGTEDLDPNQFRLR